MPPPFLSHLSPTFAFHGETFLTEKKTEMRCHEIKIEDKNIFGGIHNLCKHGLFDLFPKTKLSTRVQW